MIFFATRIRIRFIEVDPDQGDKNETDPNESGSATLKKIEILAAGTNKKYL